MLANYHTHTFRCNHAVGTEREYIEAAIKAGFKVLGFSDHVPQPYSGGYVSPIRMAVSEIADYASTLSALREEYRDRIEILIGYEVEYSRKYFLPMLEELCRYPIDYMILGQHYVPDETEGDYTGMPSNSRELLEAYTDHVIEGLRTGLFAYLAHPDLINFTGSREVYDVQMKRIIKTAIELDIPLEVNFYGFVDHRHYPSDHFFGMAVEMGARFAVGCDAHEPAMVRDPMKNMMFRRFLKRNGIEIGDNKLEIDGGFAEKAKAYLLKTR